MSGEQTLKNNVFEKEPVLFSLKEDVAKYGADCAIMLYNIRHWCAHNKANNRNYYDGRYWTFNSISAFSELFYFWSPKQIRRILDTLVAKGAIVKGNYNTSRFDRTLWYAIKDNNVANKNDVGNQTDETGHRNEEMQMHQTDKPICPNGQIYLHQTGKPIPDINTDNKHTDNNTPVILRNTIPYGNTITLYNTPKGSERVILPTGDVLGDKRPETREGMKDPTVKTVPEDYGLVRFDLEDVQVGDWERLMNWFEYHRRYRHKSSGRCYVVTPYCRKQFKQAIDFLKEQTDGNWYFAVDVLTNAVDNCYMSFGNAKDGLFYGLKSKEDYELELSFALEFKSHPEDLPERVMRYKPLVIEESIKYRQKWIDELSGKIAELEKEYEENKDNPDYPRAKWIHFDVEKLQDELSRLQKGLKWSLEQKNACQKEKTV